MTKYKINIGSTKNGALSIAHAGLDDQWAEGGDVVSVYNMPVAGWGLAELYYTKMDGSGKTAIVGNEFEMPSFDIVLQGVFKRFKSSDWTPDAKDGAVRYDVEQMLTDVQKAQAQDNLGIDLSKVKLPAYNDNELPALTAEDEGTLAFVKNKNYVAAWNGEAWYHEGLPVVPRYLTFTANEDNSGVGFCCWSEDYEVVDMGKNMQYSTDGGVTWNDYEIGVGEENIVLIDLNEGDSVMFRGINDNLAYYLESEDDYICTKCIIEGSVAASGDVTSLLNGVGGDVALADNCFYYMFEYCTGLTTAPSLTATTLANTCYSYMFSGCTGLTSAPSLPAKTLSAFCYAYMFEGCTGLTSAPTLPATTLANSCYAYMFSGCTSLTTAPSLPATTLAEYCYSSMFKGCTSLTSAPSLPATTLAVNCYNYMFNGCTSLTTAPSLPATTLAEYCYSDMFSGCTSLTTAPSLPATTLAEYCYSSMFNGCTSLTSAPSLPATTLAVNCYNYMFNGCTSLTTIEVHHTAWSPSNATTNWVKNVSGTGTFRCPSALPQTQGDNKIPTGWTIETFQVGSGGNKK